MFISLKWLDNDDLGGDFITKQSLKILSDLFFFDFSFT